MKAFSKYKQILLILTLIIFATSCVDTLPKIEDLPSADVSFEYLVKDNSYQLDYYVGASIEFTSTSAKQGVHTWDFGDGNSATGNVVTHKYTTAGTFIVKLTIEGVGFISQPVFVSDIRPILSLQPIVGGICEVLTTAVGFNMELPNPEQLTEEYTWIFPLGTVDAQGNPISIFNGKDPGKVKFSNVGSQRVRLQVKLGGRTLQEGVLNVPVAYNQAVPTLYYAVKSGNIMALKLAGTAPVGMKMFHSTWG